MTREELLARAQLLQKASSIQKGKAAASQSAEPSAPLMDEAANAGEAALQGFGQGASMGYLPQLNAIAEPAFAKAADLVTGGNSYESTPNYTARRDAWLKQQLDLQKRNPKAYLAGELGGGLSTAMAAPAAAGVEAPLIAKMAASGGLAAAQGALRNPGDAPGVVDPLQLQERGANAADIKNLAINTLAPAAGPVLKAGGKALGSVAEKAAFKALGPYARQAMQAYSKGRVNDIGRTILDEGVVSMPPRGFEALEAKATAANDLAGKKLGSTVESMAQKETGSPIGLSREDIANNLSDRLISQKDADVAGVTERNAKMQEMINNFKSGGGESVADLNPELPLLEAELKKRAVNKEIRYDRLPGADIPDTEVFNRALEGELRSGVEKGGEALAKKTGFPVDEFKNQKATYGNLSTAEDILRKRAGKEGGLRLASPSDYGVGAAGAAIGAMTGSSPEERIKHAIMGAGLGLMNKGARKYGNQINAVFMNRAGQLVDAAGNVVPEAAQTAARAGIWQKMMEKNKENP